MWSVGLGEEGGGLTRKNAERGGKREKKFEEAKKKTKTLLWPNRFKIKEKEKVRQTPIATAQDGRRREGQLNNLPCVIKESSSINQILPGGRETHLISDRFKKKKFLNPCK